MQKRVAVILGFGFLMGLGLASCATQATREPASDPSARFASAGEEKKEKPEHCLTGEERNSEGFCVRIHDFDRPFRRGGR